MLVPRRSFQPVASTRKISGRYRPTVAGVGETNSNSTRPMLSALLRARLRSDLRRAERLSSNPDHEAPIGSHWDWERPWNETRPCDRATLLTSEGSRCSAGMRPRKMVAPVEQIASRSRSRDSASRQIRPQGSPRREEPGFRVAADQAAGFPEK